MTLFSQFKTPFFKNVSLLLSGSILSQGIIFLALPILTRLFNEDLFGVYMLFSSTLLILKPIISLNFEFSLLLPKKEEEAINILFINFFIILALNLLLLLLLFLFENVIVSIFEIPNYRYFIYLVPLSLFLVCSIETLNYWSNRKLLFKGISVGNVAKSSIMSLSQILLGKSSFKSIGLIYGLVLGQFSQFIIICMLTFKSIKYNLKHVSIKKMIYLFKKYKNIPIFNSLLSFSNQISNEIPTLLITNFFGINYAGLYGLASKVTKAPPGIIGQSIAQVFFNEASNVYNSEKDLYKLVKNTYKKLFIIALPLFSMLFIISFYLEYIFGENWKATGLFVRILIPFIFISFLNSPISSITTILNKQKVNLIIDLITLAFRFLSLYIGYKIFNSVIISLILFTIVSFIYNCILMYYFLKISKKAKSNLQKSY